MLEEQKPTTADETKLKTTDYQPIPTTVRPDLLRAAAEKAAASASEEQPAEEQEGHGGQEETQQEQEEQQEQQNSAFAAEFEKYFGVGPEEAVDTVNQLIAFRDEMRLMRTWGVSPQEYDKRMEAVREFYAQLPEDGRDQFNSVEGAVAIWEYLKKTGQAPAEATRKPTQTVSRIKQATAPRMELIKKSDILRMDDQTYKANLPKITKAFREGRVVDDV
jgi:hypothetical protein